MKYVIESIQEVPAVEAGNLAQIHIRQFDDRRILIAHIWFTIELTPEIWDAFSSHKDFMDVESYYKMFPPKKRFDEHFESAKDPSSLRELLKSLEK